MVSDKTYGRAPEAKTIRGFIEALQILATAIPDGLDAKYTMDSEHDVLWSDGNIALDSEAGKRLMLLGWHFDEEVDRWAYFT
jgi:hypothetical protein